MGQKYYRDVVIGGMNRSDIWSAGRNADVLFVDADYGSAQPGGSDGTSPSRAIAFGTTGVAGVGAISAAVTAISYRDSVIYVRPRGTAAAAQTYYTDNVIIPVTKGGLKIIGAGSDENRPYYGVDIKATTITSPVITVRAPRVTLEGLRLAGTGQTAGYSTVYAADNASTVITAGLVIRKCRFGNGRGTSFAAGSIFLNSSWYNTIEDCDFDSNVLSICAVSTSGGITIGPFIRRCKFGGPVAVRECDIQIEGGSTSWGLLVDDCRFNDGLPALSSGTVKKFISITQTITGQITNCNFAYTSTAATGLVAATGTIINAGASIFSSNNWYDATVAGKGMLDRV